MQHDIIKKNFKEFFDLAEYAFNTKKFNGAAALYYKALVEICDLELLRRANKIGSNHNERFLLLKMYNPELYKIADLLFNYYRDSYSKSISEIVAKQIREGVMHAKELAKIE